MKCVRCSSLRVVTFIDFFGNKRAFCRSCQESMLIQKALINQKKLAEFAEYYRGGLFEEFNIGRKMPV
ncbi:MAG: hypothetical protein N3E38_00380 [Candidatus Aenigmarchaeota archaeon]|nr:hypothetical protein [Candidatus Aenigmarchaeota archaeon]MCX8179183.1 hypothetical protein [Candidatus Aenigmarchaeota archaeon]